MSRIGSNRRGADGVRVESFPEFTFLQILAEIQNMMTEMQCEMSNSQDESTACQCTTTLCMRRKKGNDELRIANSKIVADYATRFARGHWSFLGPGSEKRWYRTHTYKPNGEWDRVAEDLMLNYSESDPVFRGSSALEW